MARYLGQCPFDKGKRRQENQEVHKQKVMAKIEMDVVVCAEVERGWFLTNCEMVLPLTTLYIGLHGCFVALCLCTCLLVYIPLATNGTWIADP